MNELSDEKILEAYLSNDLNQKIFKTLDKNDWTTPQKLRFFDIIFKVLDVIFHYEWAWVKKWDYLKSYLAQLSADYQKIVVFFANIIAKNRLDIIDSDNKSLLVFLKELDYEKNNTVDNEILKSQKIGSDLKKVVEGFCNVRGFVKSQDEIINDFVSENEAEIRKRIAPETLIRSNQELQSLISTHINDYLKHDIELDGGYRYLWRNDNPLKEVETQPFIKILLNKYCNDSKIYISRESKVANGNVDFTFTDGEHRISLEVKNAHHENVEKAVNTQLSQYMDGDKTKHGIYLILWYKSDNGFLRPKDYGTINDLKTKVKLNIPEGYNIDIIIINCKEPIMPSRNKTTKA